MSINLENCRDYERRGEIQNRGVSDFLLKCFLWGKIQEQNLFLKMHYILQFKFKQLHNKNSLQLEIMQRINRKLQNLVQKIGRDNSAYLCWFIASVFWSISFIYPNQHKIDAFTSNLSRGVALVAFNSIGLYWRQLFTSEPSPFVMLNSKELIAVSVRHVLLSIYGFGFSQSQFYLSAPVLYTIYFSGPLFIMIIDFTYFKITISKQQTMGVLLTGMGVLLTANGQALWAWVMGESQFSTTFKNYKTDSFLVKSIVALIMMALTFGWACAQIMVREVKNKNHWTINLNFGIILTIFSSLMFFKNPETVVSNNAPLFINCLLYQGIIIAIAQAFFMGALLLSKKSGPITMIGFVGVVISYMISVLRYHQPLSIFCVIGACLALIGIYKTVIK